MRKALLLLLVLVGVGCGDSNNNKTPDAAPPIDAAIDGAPPAPPDCTTYCNTIQTNCTGTNAQYGTTANCMAACASFPVGKTGDTSGNTLGCRIYHAGAPAVMNATLHCPHAGPGGDLTSVVSPPGTCGDACTSFCTLEIMACGTTASNATTGQYADMATCITACKAFPNADHALSPTSKGDSLACRLYHATNAAVAGSAMVHCPHTAAQPAGANNPCLAGSPATP